MIPRPAYVTSGPHLSGYQVTLGYETLADAGDAHEAIAKLTQQPNPPLGGDEEKVEPVAWRRRPLQPSTGSGGEWVLYGPEDAAHYNAATDRYEVQPLYAAPVLPVEVREKIEMVLIKYRNRMVTLDAATDAILSTIKGDA